VAEVTPEVLAAEFDAAANAFDKDVRDHGEDLDVGCRDTLRGCADRVRTMLAPAHAALAAERDKLADELAGARRKLIAEGARARAEAAVREQSARLARTSDGPLEALAAAWERQASDQEKKIDSGEVTRTSKRVSQARLLRALAVQLREAIAREALGGGHG